MKWNSQLRLLLLICSIASINNIALPDSDSNKDELMPSAIQAGQQQKSCTIDSSKIPRFAANSPFAKKYTSPLAKKDKRIWASSYLWQKAPDLMVEQWLSDTPCTTGKYILVEFWATWCAPCRRSIPILNQFHEKFKEELVVIGITNEPEQEVKKFVNPKINFFSAIDTQARMKDMLGVFGIPHAILIEPGGYVVWEGYPLLKDYELTNEMIEKFLAVGRKLNEEKEQHSDKQIDEKELK